MYRGKRLLTVVCMILLIFSLFQYFCWSAGTFDYDGGYEKPAFGFLQDTYQFLNAEEKTNVKRTTFIKPFFLPYFSLLQYTKPSIPVSFNGTFIDIALIIAFITLILTYIQQKDGKKRLSVYLT